MEKSPVTTKVKRKEKKSSKPSKRKLVASCLIAVGTLVLLLVSLLGDLPSYVLRYRMRLSEGSDVYQFLERETEMVHLSVYLFNITNAEEFTAGEDYKLKVQEVGPFTYKEIRRNEHLELDKEAEILRYQPRIKLVFSPEESIGRPEEVNVTMPNIPMLGLTTKMNEYPYFLRFAFDTLTTQMHSKAIVNMDAHTYLWGYEEPLVYLAHTIIPGLIQFEKMGILDRIYDNNAENNLEVSTADDSKFMIRSRNGHKKLKMADSENPDECFKCSTFENAYEGLGYPTGLTPDFPVRLFRNGLCRIVDMEFNRTKTMSYGGDALVYHFSDSFYTISPRERTDGVLSLPECFFGMPLAISKTHFLDMNPSIYERVEGMHPDHKKHMGWITIEPKIGIQLETVFSLQMNLVVGDVYRNKETRSFSNMVIPICYLSVVQPEIKEDVINVLKYLYSTGPYITIATNIFLFVLTLLSWAYFACVIYRNYKYSSSASKECPSLSLANLKKQPAIVNGEEGLNNSVKPNILVNGEEVLNNSVKPNIIVNGEDGLNNYIKPNIIVNGEDVLNNSVKTNIQS